MRRPSLRTLSVGTLVLLAVVGYQFTLFWTNYGPVPFHDLFVLVLLAVPVALAVTAGRGRWSWSTVVALLALGLATSTVGFVGSGGLTRAVARSGPDVYHAFRYDWTSNVLRYGQTFPGGVPVSSVRPNRLSTLLGTVALSLGTYGWLPKRRPADDAPDAPDHVSAESPNS
ncbi:hypothetical protein [Halomarina oriensis]|uniref:Uncharacterized protein n=1 Tax=Halomarina oriensis TaxID=671145 RepID=A0A6B0GQT4_9EURY|nr:hypothetical protein [Halomarina oriensis]MWG34485.1 hypothetical protein [Halomarina oriensis]